MLHLGCGAGGHDFHFKKHFQVTGVDLSQGMLDLAKKTNTDVTYVLGDMRSISLNKKFDAVVIPDSIAYMSTLLDLKQVLLNATRHLKIGGVLLVVAHTKEEFKENNFAYTGVKDDIHITLFENNHIVSDSTYEAIMVYLIRQGGEASIYHKGHFRTTELGSVKLFVNTQKPPFIYLETDDGVTIFNMKNEDETQEIFGELLRQIE